MHYIYILVCADGSLYTGYAVDPKDREAVHNSGKGAKYTRSRLPVKLVYTEEFSSISEAQIREAEIKSWPRQKKIKTLGLNIRD